MTGIRYGINLLLWPLNVLEEPAPLFTSLKAMGFDGVEVPVNPDTPNSYRRVGQALATSGLAATATARGNNDADMSSHDAAVRQRGVERVQRALDIAADFGAEILAGPMHCMPGKLDEAPLDAGQIEALAEGLMTANSEARDRGLKLCPEILNRYESAFPNTLKQCASLARVMGDEKFAFHYDTYHAHIEEQAPDKAIIMYANQVGHVHFSESNRGPIGSGQVNWSKTANALLDIKYEGWITAEAFCQSNEALTRAMRIWRPLIDDPMVYSATAIREMRTIVIGN